MIVQAPYLLIAACYFTKVDFTLCPGVLRAQLDWAGRLFAYCRVRLYKSRLYSCPGVLGAQRDWAGRLFAHCRVLFYKSRLYSLSRSSQSPVWLSRPPICSLPRAILQKSLLFVQEFSEPSVIEQAPYLLIAACEDLKVVFTLCLGVLRAQCDRAGCLRAHCRGRFHLHHQVKIAVTGTRQSPIWKLIGWWIFLRNRHHVSVLWSIIFFP